MKFMLREIVIFFIIVGPAFFLKDASINLRLLLIVYPCYVVIRLLVWLIMVLVRYFRKLKTEKKPLLNKTTLSIGVPILAVLLICAGYDLMLSIGPTAIVIDAETGKPVEGAVALAQWNRFAASIPEGGSEAFDRAKESFSGKDGKVFIDGFWGLYIFSIKPSLTVYKPGYVIWNSKWICPAYEKRADFDKNNRTVKLLKFDTEAPKWVENYKDRGSPRDMQDSFFLHCYSGEMNNKYHGQISFGKIFDDYEYPQRNKEKFERGQKSKLQ